MSRDICSLSGELTHPGLDPNHRISATADDVLDEIARAYVLEAVAGIRQVAGHAGAGLPEALDRLMVELSKLDAVLLLRWSRDSACRWPRNEGVIHSAEFQRAVLALALILDPAALITVLRLPQYAYVRSGHTTFGLLVAKNKTATELMIEARRRAEDANRNGLDLGPDLRFICVGNVDDVERPAVVADVIDDTAGVNLIDAARMNAPRLIAAQAVLEGRAA